MRIVIRTPNWLGDLMLSLPAIEALRARFPTDTLIAAAPSHLAPLFDAVPAVDGALPLAGSFRWREWHAQAKAMRAGRFDAALLLPNSFQAAWVAAWASVPGRWGYRADGRGWLLTTRIRRRAPVAGHAAEDYLRLVAGLSGDGALPLAPPRLVPRPDQRARARRMLAARAVAPDAVLVGVAPGAAYGSAKRWPPERFADALVSLASQAGVTGVLVGAETDRAAGCAIESRLASARPAAGKVVNLIGQTDLSTLTGVLSLCRVLVSNDSGAMHVGAALGVPVTAVFGPTDERRTRPLGQGHAVISEAVACRPCGHRACPIDHRCMTGVTPRAIAASVAAQLGGGQMPSRVE